MYLSQTFQEETNSSLQQALTDSNKKCNGILAELIELRKVKSQIKFMNSTTSFSKKKSISGYSIFWVKFLNFLPTSTSQKKKHGKKKKQSLRRRTKIWSQKKLSLKKNIKTCRMNMHSSELITITLGKRFMHVENGSGPIITDNGTVRIIENKKSFPPLIN